MIQAAAKSQNQSGDDLERLTGPNSSATSWSESRYVFFLKSCFVKHRLDLSVDSEIRLDRDRFATTNR